MNILLEYSYALKLSLLQTIRVDLLNRRSARFERTVIPLLINWHSDKLAARRRKSRKVYDIFHNKLKSEEEKHMASWNV